MGNMQRRTEIFVGIKWSSLVVIFSILGMGLTLLFKSTQLSPDTLNMIHHYFVFFVITTIIGVVLLIINFRRL